MSQPLASNSPGGATADKKFVIYKWASEQCVSETYKYRARATPYTVVATSKSWVLEDEDGDKQPKRSLARRYTDNMKNILDKVMADSTVSESSIQFETNDKLKDDLRREHLEQLAGNPYVLKATETSQSYADLPDSDIPEEEDFTDDGYSQLTVHDYIACRTIPQHRLIQQQLPELNNRKNALQVLMYVLSATSVMLATLNMDLYIAVSVSGCVGLSRS